MPPLPDTCSLNLFLTSAEPRSANYLEVGGADTAMLNAVGNTVSNVPGFVVPISGVFLRNLTGAQTLVHSLLDGAVASDLGVLCRLVGAAVRDHRGNPVRDRAGLRAVGVAGIGARDPSRKEGGRGVS